MVCASGFRCYVLAGAQGGDGHVVVKVLRRHDEHGVDGLVGEQLAIVVIGLRRDAVDGLDAVFGARDVAGIRVADSGDGDALRFGFVQPVETSVTARADADPADVQLVAAVLCLQNGGRAECGGGRRSLQKIAAWQAVGHDVLRFTGLYDHHIKLTCAGPPVAPAVRANQKSSGPAAISRVRRGRHSRSARRRF